MRIYPIINYSYKERKLEPQVNQDALSFEAKARVDKGLQRFYEANQNRMPVTLEKYISGLKDKNTKSPMEALKEAFEFLNLAETIQEIKEVFPFEPLFSKLKNPSDSKASIGILRLIKEDAELLELSGEGVLKDKSNLTVYLVKKIFLENKTIKEINKDLENDLNEDLKAEYKFKYPDTDYIHKTTLKALGLGGISQEYRNSLRFTNEEYADIQGEKVSQGLQNFWESLTPEERTAKAKKSVEKFESWWNSHSKTELLTMIALQMSELEMLKDFRKFQKATEQEDTTEKTIKEQTIEPQNSKIQPKTHVKVGSDRLKNDELFIKWATNNLKLFMENLSEADKDSLHIRRMQLLASRWAEMTPAERTEYISKIKSGLEPLRFTMIDAWNHSESIIKDLYTHLKANQIYKPSDFLYSPDELSKSQSEVMTAFWGKYPEHCRTLGLNIVKSGEKVQMAISRGTFDELKNQILRDKKDRIKAFEKFRFVQAPKIDAIIRAELEEYAENFFDAKNNANYDELVEILAEYDIYTLRKVFSDKSPAKIEDKEKIYNELKTSLLPKIKDKYDCVFEYVDDPFEQEKAINLECLSISRKMKLLPKQFVDLYIKELKVLSRKKAIMDPLNSNKVERKEAYISHTLKGAIVAMEVSLSKVLYKATNDISFMENSFIDNNAILNSFMSYKNFPCRIIQELGTETREITLYSKPNLKSLLPGFHSAFSELKKYYERPSEGEEQDIKDAEELIKKLSLDFSNKACNEAIVSKFTFIESNISMVQGSRDDMFDFIYSSQPFRKQFF